MEQAVAFMTGVTAVVMGFSLLLRWRDWREWIRLLRTQGRPAALIIGYLHLIIGTFIVGFHWKWEGMPLLVTVVGLTAIAEGVVYTLFPNFMLVMLAWCEQRGSTLFRVAGLTTIIIGGVILCEWWQYMQSAGCTWQPCFNQASNL
jgi:hypothetical protein